MLGFSNEEPGTPRKRKRANLEFNFITGGGAATSRAHKNKVRLNPASAPLESTSDASPAANEKPENPAPSLSPTTTTREERPAMSTNTPNPGSNPAPIRTGSIERQIKEQKTVSNVLNGMALALICGILLVTALAGTGGYVLWKQLQDQSASLAVLEQNTKDRMFDLKAEMVANDADLAKVQEQSNLRLVELTTQFESYRSESAQILAELKASNRSMERSLSLYQKKTQDQDVQLAQLRRNR